MFLKINIIIIAVLFTACGYTITGLNHNNTKIAFDKFSNNTMEPGLDKILAERIKTDFIKKTGFQVVNEVKNSDYSIEGSVDKISQNTISVSSNDGLVQEYSLTITCGIVIYDRNTNEILTRKDYKLSSEYPVTGNQVIDSNSKFRSIREISSILAEKIATLIITVIHS